MTRNTLLPSLLAGAAILLTTAVTSHAGQPTKQLKSTTDALLEVLENPELAGEQNREQRRTKLRSILRDRFALRQMGRLTVQTEAWNQAGDEQHERFFELFEALLERTYLAEIEGYEGQTIKFQGESIQGRTATVTTLIRRRKTEDLPITYRVLNRGDDWVVYDVIISGVSVVRNYRDQFAEILNGGTFADLIAKLKEKGLE